MMLWHYSKIVVPNTSFFEKIMEIFIINAAYLHLARLRMRLSVFRELLSLRCINIKNLCAHHQEEVLKFPKHPHLAKFA